MPETITNKRSFLGGYRTVVYPDCSSLKKPIYVLKVQWTVHQKKKGQYYYMLILKIIFKSKWKG